MTRIIDSLAEIAADYDALFCDLWGCLHNGIRAFPEAVAALRGFRAGGGRVVLLTNAPRPWLSTRRAARCWPKSWASNLGKRPRSSMLRSATEGRRAPSLPSHACLDGQ